MTRYCEQRICFNFDDNFWEHIIKFDEHPDYKKIEKLDKSKGVDFLTINSNNICFIEIKDFKNYRIENKERLKQNANELMTEVAIKVKDSLACIVAANRNSTNDKQVWSNALDVLANIRKNITVILWLEKDQERKKTNNKRAKSKAYDYKRTLQNKLNWLLPKSGICVLNKQDYYKKELQKRFNFEVDFESIEN